jgi:hypothetical protein
MTRAGTFRTRILTTLFAASLLSGFSVLFAEGPAIVPSVAPGVYADPQLVSFAVPSGSRLLVSIDGAAPFEPSGPVLLSVEPGAEKDFPVEAELHPLLPESGTAATASFLWRIDRKPPESPMITASSVDGGYFLSLMLSGRGSVQYQIYHPLYRAYNSDMVASGGSVFLPAGAILCAYGIDEAGNRGRAVSFGPFIADADAVPFKIVNPVPGNWADAQVLLVESSPGTEIYYSIDGSDPAVSGLDYSGPVLLETTGMTRLRVSAVSASGKRFSGEVFYTVDRSGEKSVPGLPAGGNLVDLKEFGELTVPEGYTWSIGDGAPSNPGGKAIVFSSVRGTVCQYPLTVTDGKTFWRWICSSGVRAAPSMVDAPAKDAGKPEVRILDWYFVSVDSASPVYCSSDRKNWRLYTGPVFFDRASDATFWWYSPAWKSGEVQRVALPARVSLTGISDNAITGNPVFLEASPSPFECHYEVSSSFRAREPDASSPLLASGLLFEVPSGVSSAFSVRIVATYDGLVHGELETSFLLDRKAPRAPSAGIDPDVSWSRNPVRMTPSGEDMIQVSIRPDSFSHDGKSFVLSGDPARAVDYEITLFAVDRAGNKSPVVTRAVTVDLNAVYVDAAKVTASVRNGSPSSPYASLDDALDAVRGSAPWRIYVSGETTLNRIHTLRSGVAICGAKGARIITGADACLTVPGGTLAISGCAIVRAEEEKPAAVASEPEPFDLPGRLHAVLDVSSATLTLDSVDLSSSGPKAGPLVRAADSSVFCKSSTFALDGNEYALLFDLLRSDVKVDSCSFTVSARNASALSLMSSTVSLKNSSVKVVPGLAGRAMEAWDSRITVSGLSVERAGSPAENRDTAVWLDRKSALLSADGISVKGFWRDLGGESK